MQQDATKDEKLTSQIL